jgi:hypothetical protein
MNTSDIFDELFSKKHEYNMNQPFSISTEETPVTPTPSVSPTNTETGELKEIQDILDFNKELLLTYSYDMKLYRIPSQKSYDARKIWLMAGIPAMVTARHAEYLLLNWAYTYATLEIVDKQIVSIKWKTASNSMCVSPWKIFVKWLLCAGV